MAVASAACGFCVPLLWRSPRRLAVTSMASQSASRRVLVTGGTGFVGSKLCEELIENGYDVHVLRRTIGGSDELDALKVTSHLGDVTKPETVEAAVQDGPWRAVFHAAGVVAYSSKLADLMQAVNVDGTRNVVEAIAKVPVETAPRLVYVSSVVAVGANRTVDAPPVTEDIEWDEAGDKIGYLRTKRLAEKLVLEAVAENRIKAVVVCPSNVYGSSDAKKGSRSNQIKAAQGKLRFYTRGGVNVIGAKQCCAAVVKAMEIGTVGERYILGGENLFIRDMLQQFSQAANNKPPAIELPNWVLYLACFFGQYLLGSKSLTMERAAVATLYHWYDSSKAIKELGLKETSAADAIRESVEWMVENGYVIRGDEDGEKKDS